MATLNVAVRLCCIIGAHAGITIGTPTIIRDSPAAGVGFMIEAAGCLATTATPDGCTSNETAIFKVKDDSGTTMVDTFCSAFDSFQEPTTSSGATTASAQFFYAFAMTAGHTGSYWMSKGCFDTGVTTTSSDVTALTTWTALDYETSPGVQYTGQPTQASGEHVLTANQSDVFIPYLLLATPHSPNAALESGTYRTGQFKYVTAGTAVTLYFNEPVTGTANKVYAYAYTPSETWTSATGTKTVHKEVAGDAFTVSMLGTKASASFSLVENRLYKILIDAGAFEDSNGNAAVGANGLGNSYTECVTRTSANTPIQEAGAARDCLIAFVVPMTISAFTTQYPAPVAGDPVLLEQTTSITKTTNVILEFPQAVEPGSYSSTALKMSFGPRDISGAELVIGGTTTSNCITAGTCHKLFSSKYYIFEPAADLQDTVTTWNSTEVSVSFPTGAFDYVNAFSYTFITNRSDYSGHAPEIVAYSFDTAGETYEGDVVYYEDAALQSWESGETLSLYFDTKVVGASDKYVALRGGLLLGAPSKPLHVFLRTSPSAPSSHPRLRLCRPTRRHRLGVPSAHARPSFPGFPCLAASRDSPALPSPGPVCSSCLTGPPPPWFPPAHRCSERAPSPPPKRVQMALSAAFLARFGFGTPRSRTV